MSELRAVYLDLDGTLLGRGASLLHDGEGAVTLLGVRALEACLRAGVEIVLYSGRRRAQVMEDARLLGARAYVFEAGGGLVVDGEAHWLTHPFVPEEGWTPHEAIARTGAPDLLLERYAATLEHHAPWHLGREVSHLFRGLVDVEEADALVERHGLRLLDNGVLEEDPSRRAYHLVPRGVSKAAAVAAHMRMRALAPDACVAVGDSREDLGVAAVVGTFWLVANAPAELGGANVRRAGAGHGPGVYEAVLTELAERR